MSDEDDKKAEDSGGDDAVTAAEASAAAEDSSKVSATGDDVSDAEASKGKTDKASGEDRMDLPKWNRARVKRKQPKGEEQDAFQQSVRKAGKTALTRAPVVLGGLVVVAAIIASVFWYRDKVEEDNAVATRILSKAVGMQARGRVVPDIAEVTKDRKLPPPLPLIENEEQRDQAVEAALGDLQAEAGDSDAAKASKLLSASRLMEDGAFADAQASYRTFLDDSPSHPLAFLAREGLALSLEAGGNVDDALGELETLAGSEGSFYRDQALWHKGRILEGQGKADEALEVYKSYIAEYPLEQKSIARDSVVARLDELAPDLVPESAKKPNLGGLGGPGGFSLPAGLGQ